jgi:ankyrin repeat protein
MRWAKGAGLLLVVMACKAQPGSPLATAAGSGDVERIGTLLAVGANPDERDNHGWTPLQWAARGGYVGAIRALVAGGAHVDLKDSGVNGWTPLMHAIHKEQNEAALALLEAGADPNLRSRGDATALLMAAGYGNTTLVRALIERGADPRAATDGVTALWAAAGGGAIADFTDGPPLGSCFPETARVLQAAAPDLRLEDDFETRALAWFARSPECADLLRRLKR